jgi:chorismate mutase
MTTSEPVQSPAPQRDQPHILPVDGNINQLRQRIDDIDSTLIRLWRERCAASKEVGVRRVASGGTRLVLSREQEIIQKFHTELGPLGTQLAMLLLRAGRGAL